MDKGVAVVVAAVVGGLVVTQGPLNSQLGRTVGGLQASVIALTVSLVAVLVLAALTDGLSGLRRIGDAPPPGVFGWLGVERSPITVAKVSGVLLLAVGTWLVIRD